MKKWLIGVMLCGSVSVYAGPVTEKLRTFLQRNLSGQGRFEQKVVDRTGRDVVPASAGSFQFSRPGLFSWIYETPYRQRIRSDGKTLWLYDRDLAQVNQQNLTQSIPQSPATLLFGQGKLDPQQWAIRRISRDQMRLTPKQAGVFQKVMIYFSSRSTFPEKMDLRDSFGQHTWIFFHDFSRQSFDAKDFQWTPPEGVDVLRMQ